MNEYVDLKRVQELVADIRKPNQVHYFTDLIISSTLGWLAFIYALLSTHDFWRAFAFIVAVVLLYRSLVFIHEIVHQQSMKLFRYVWHAVVGVPMLIPFMLYITIHQDHHNKETYGTVDDGEYIQAKGRWGAAITQMFLVNFLLPVMLLIRFAILTPLSLIFPLIRTELIPAFIHLVIRIPFRAPPIKKSARVEAMIVEWCCCLWAWVLLMSVLWFGWSLLFAWSLLVFLISTLNTVRILGDTHLYVEEENGRDARGQMLDSINLDSNSILALIICPVGLRFHALHHIAPYLPYHNLPSAHRRLMAELPPNSEYHQVTVYSISEGITRLRQATA